MGAVVILPDGFKLAPPKMITPEIKAKNKEFLNSIIDNHHI